MCLLHVLSLLIHMYVHVLIIMYMYIIIIINIIMNMYTYNLYMNMYMIIIIIIMNMYTYNLYMYIHVYAICTCTCLVNLSHRGETLFSGTLLLADKDDPNSTRLTLLLQDDIKGYVPRFIINFFYARAPLDWRENLYNFYHNVYKHEKSSK